MNEVEILKAVECLVKGGIIAYPTEAVYGLGCDPFNQKSVYQLLSLKQRSVEKGLILVAKSWEQITDLIAPLPEETLLPIRLSWPGPLTWVFPASNQVPPWIRGNFDSVALRVSAHPVVQRLCSEFGKPIVSTSANHEGEPPARDVRTVKMMFEQLCHVVDEKIGGQIRPTEIRDAISGDIIRKS